MENTEVPLIRWGEVSLGGVNTGVAHLAGGSQV